MLIYVNRNASNAQTHKVNGSATVNLDGIIYMANQDIEFNGSATMATQNLMLVVDEVKFSGNVDLSGFGGSGQDNNKVLIESRLVE